MQARLLTGFDNELTINLAPSISFTLQDKVALIFLIATEKVMYFSAFSPKQVNSLSNFSAMDFMIKWKL